MADDIVMWLGYKFRVLTRIVNGNRTLEPVVRIAAGEPVAKAKLFNAALPAAEANLLADDIVPTSSPSYLQIYICAATGGVFRVARTSGGTTVTENLNGGVALLADAAYLFTVPWRAGDSINFRYSATGEKIKSLIVDEVALG